MTRASRTVDTQQLPTEARDRPAASSDVVRRRMENTKRRDTREELRIRSLVHRMGLRFRIDASPLVKVRSRADLVFSGSKVAVFVDSCFWHGCPKHGTWPKANASWWRNKIRSNQERDRRVTGELTHAGWKVIRIWAHELPEKAANRIAAVVRRRSVGARGSSGNEGSFGSREVRGDLTQPNRTRG